MSQQTRRSVFVYVAVALVLVVGGLTVWKVGSPSSRRGGADPVSEAQRERERVAAIDPAFDPAKPLGTLEGEVKDADGRPVDGAVVAITRQRGRDELPSFSRPIPRTTTTAGGGRFRLTDVLPGEYGVTAASALVGSPARQGKVKVTSGETTRLTLTLGKGGALFTGEVSDVGGGPIAGARALLRTMSFGGGPGQEAQLFQVAADDKGVFKVRLGAGEYEVSVLAEGYAPARDRLVLSAELTRRYKLNPAARLSGRVLDRQSGEPVAGAGVWLRQDRLESFVDRDATTDLQGRFSFDDLAAGGYVVLARSQHRIGLSRTVSVGIAQGAEVDVLVERGRSIKGTTVGSDGKGIEGVRVFAGRFDPPYERPVVVKSGKEGAFVLEGLLPAKYRVNGWVEGRGGSKPETAQVTSRDVEGLRLAMLEAAVVRGQVVDANGQPVAEASVTGMVEMQGPERRFSMDRANTDGAGKFELTRLQPGRVTLTAKHPERGNTKWGPAEVTAVPAGLVLKLVMAGAIEGTVKFEDGSPAKGVVVFAQLAQPSGPFFGPPDQVSTDDNGRFRIGGLDANRYMVMARPNSMMGPAPRGRQEVTLAVAETKSGLELVLPVGGKKIAGKVVTPEGQPVSGAVVSAGMERDGFAFRMPQREGMFFGGGGNTHAVTDPDGNFSIDDLQDGQYTIWASDSMHADGETKGVAAGSSGVSVRLQGGASVAGVVQTKQGKPVSDYNITALPGGGAGNSPDDRMRTQMTARMWSPSVQVHDPAGAFAIGRLSPGAYQLTVTTADGQGGMLPVTVAAGETKQNLQIQIDAGAKLVGRVLELDSSKPLEGVNVTVMSSTNRLTAMTAADGSFTLEGLAPGRSRVDFRLGNGETHVGEHTEVEAKPGGADVDVGVIKLLKGSMLERGGSFVGRGRIGFTPALVDGRPSVTGVREGFPADKAGLKQGDLILSLNGKAVDGYGNGALDFLGAGKIGEPLMVKIQPKDGGPPREVKIDRVPMDFVPPKGGRGTGQAATASTGR